MRPVILIAGTRTDAPAASAFRGWLHQETTDAYVASVSRAGGVPLMAPVVDDPDAARAQLAVADGLLLPGGRDIDPSRYGQERSPLCGESDTMRDRHEASLIAEARRTRIPTLGICRGLQALNVAFGGTLWQDATLRTPPTIVHARGDRPTTGSHHVSLVPDGFLRTLFPSDILYVNSLHHQMVRDLAPGLRIAARCTEDGVVEAVEAVDGPAWAVQWHPEAMLMADDAMLPLFRFFVDRCRR